MNHWETNLTSKRSGGERIINCPSLNNTKPMVVNHNQYPLTKISV